MCHKLLTVERITQNSYYDEIVTDDFTVDILFE